MYAIAGVTGQVGGAVARELIAVGQQVRAIVRDPAKGSAWARRGAEIAVADFLDAPALERAFRGTEGVFVMVPANFAPSRGFPETTAVVDSVARALAAASPAKIVCLSSIGAHLPSGLGLITALRILERGLQEINAPLAFVRPGWFMENCGWDIPRATKEGAFDSFLQPLDRGVPMVATADVGRVAAETLRETWPGHRIIEIEGATRISPNEVAFTLGELLRRDVVARAVPRASWRSAFTAQGSQWPEPRIEMLDGFNSGWIDFGGAEAVRRYGQTSFRSVVQGLIARNEVMR